MPILDVLSIGIFAEYPYPGAGSAIRVAIVPTAAKDGSITVDLN